MRGGDGLFEVEPAGKKRPQGRPAAVDKTFRAFAPHQILLLPPSLDEWLPEDHLARFVADLVDEVLNLSPVLANYTEKRGYPPYDPRLMPRLLIYGYTTGVRSSRAIERTCTDDVAFRFLAAGQEPDFRSISRFRRRHLDALVDLFTQSLHLAQKLGTVKMGRVALDGTKLEANASRHKAMSYGRLVGQGGADRGRDSSSGGPGPGAAGRRPGHQKSLLPGPVHRQQFATPRTCHDSSQALKSARTTGQSPLDVRMGQVPDVGHTQGEQTDRETGQGQGHVAGLSMLHHRTAFSQGVRADLGHLLDDPAAKRGDDTLHLRVVDLLQQDENQESMEVRVPVHGLYENVDEPDEPRGPRPLVPEPDLKRVVKPAQSSLQRGLEQPRLATEVVVKRAVRTSGLLAQRRDRRRVVALRAHQPFCGVEQRFAAATPVDTGHRSLRRLGGPVHAWLRNRYSMRSGRFLSAALRDPMVRPS